METSLPGTAERVPASTRETINEAIRHRTGDRQQYYAEHPEGIDDRLAELERE
ncbi:MULTISPECIES: hypothetical protein [Natrialbaceae]|uniref:hypothetical protein n=1 Tax=Natrialbaceae TaxID=1644061 RepID=UPI00207CE0E6|nr:hypothetical protein [Natronococcus sp. CG52]